MLCVYLTCKNQSFLITFFQRTFWPAKIKLFFDYFLSKDNLTDKNQSFLITFFQRTFWPAKIKVFSITFFQRTIWHAKIKVFFDYFLSKDDLTGKNQSFFDNFIWNLRKKSILFLWKKSLFLSITIFLPDFYHLATLSEQNHSFLCKVLTNFFNYKMCIWCEESIFCRKKWYISN